MSGYNSGKETFSTLHLWSQIIGKIKLNSLPWINHSWHVTLFVTSNGLTTQAIPNGGQHFQIDLNLLEHFLLVSTSRGESRQFDLRNISVADFYRKIFLILSDLNIDVQINPIANEIPELIPLDQDEIHKTYEPEEAIQLHQKLLFAQEIFTQFRSRFSGKCSPVHFFWGGFDLAVTRFSGRSAPVHPGGVPHLPDWVAREAYSHEVSSCGFWPGNDALPEAVFYSYAYPEPVGYKDAAIKPSAAYYHQELREFILPYEAVQKSADPGKTLMEFLQSTFDAAARTGNWDKKLLEPLNINVFQSISTAARKASSNLLIF